MLQCVSDVSTSFIGPIGKLLINRYKNKSQTVDGLCELLSEHVGDADDKKEFITKIKKCF